MSPQNRRPVEGTYSIEEKIYSDAQFKAALASISRGMESRIMEELSNRMNTAKPVEKKTSAKEWIAIAVSLVMWFASITYMAGGLGQRVTELEESLRDLKQNVMSKDRLEEKFDGINIRLHSLEEVQKSLIVH